MSRSGSLAPRFVNEDVMAEITYSAVHARLEVLAWPRAAFCSVSICKLRQESPCGCVVLGYVMAAATAVVQPGENKHVCNSYGSSHVLPPSSWLMSCLPWTQ